MGSGKVVVWTNDLCACGGGGEEVGRGLDAPAQSRAGPHVAGSEREIELNCNTIKELIGKNRFKLKPKRGTIRGSAD